MRRLLGNSKGWNMKLMQMFSPIMGRGYNCSIRKHGIILMYVIELVEDPFPIPFAPLQPIVS